MLVKATYDLDTPFVSIFIRFMIGCCVNMLVVWPSQSGGQ